MRTLAWIGGVLALLLLGGFAGRDYLGIPDIPAEVLKARYGQDARYVDVLDTQVRIKESGQGEPLLLLHGFASSADTWDGWRRQLGNRYHVIAVDVTPFAITGPMPGRPVNPAELQVFLDVLVEKLQLQQFYLAGNSLGGYLSWNYALRHPEKVKKLILIDSAGYPHDKPLPVKMMETPVLRDIAAHLSPWPIVAASVRDVYGHPEKVTDAQIHLYADMMRREGSRSAVSELMSSLRFEPESIRFLRVPTLIMWGARDRWIPPAHAERFHSDIPGSQLIMYPELGHIPMEEDPERTAADAARFLQP